MEAEKAIEAIISEYGRATHLNGAFPNAHCGYAVILEEMDELWEHIKKKSADRDPEEMRRETAQIGAMALRLDAAEPESPPE